MQESGRVIAHSVCYEIAASALCLLSVMKLRKQFFFRLIFAVIRYDGGGVKNVTFCLGRLPFILHLKAALRWLVHFLHLEYTVTDEFLSSDRTNGHKCYSPKEKISLIILCKCKGALKKRHCFCLMYMLCCPW